MAAPVFTLGIETSGRTFSLALLKDGEPASSFFMNDGHNHSKRLVGGIRDFLKTNGITIQQIKYFAVDIGPGSFTGVRVGVSAARMIAQSLKTELFGVSSLDVSAGFFDFFKGIIIPVIPAVKGEIYVSAFDNSGLKMKRVKKEVFFKVGDIKPFLRSILHGKPKNILVCGSAAGMYEEFLKSVLPENAIIKKSEPLAEQLAAIAWKRVCGKYPVDGRWRNVLPNYIKPPYAFVK